MKKRVLAMVLALGMTFGLAGCAGSDKAADTNDKNDIVNIGLHFILKNVRPYAAPCSEA